MQIKFKSMRKQEKDLFKRWLNFRSYLLKQESEFARAYSRFFNTKNILKKLSITPKEKKAMLAWLSIQKSKSYRKLRVLPGAVRYSRMQITRTLEKINKW